MSTFPYVQVSLGNPLGNMARDGGSGTGQADKGSVTDVPTAQGTVEWHSVASCH